MKDLVVWGFDKTAPINNWDARFIRLRHTRHGLVAVCRDDDGDKQTQFFPWSEVSAYTVTKYKRGNV